VAFIRKKRVNGREYYQLVENYRDDGKHRQRVLAHLGKHSTIEAAIEDLERSERAEKERGWPMRPETRDKLARLRDLLTSGKVKPETPEVKARRQAARQREFEELRRGHAEMMKILTGQASR